MNRIRCPFCGHPEENKYQKGLIQKLQDHILQKHLDNAFNIIMRNDYNSQSVKEEIVKEFMWRYNYFTQHQDIIKD